MGGHSLHEGIFPTQGSNLGHQLCRQILYHMRQIPNFCFTMINWKGFPSGSVGKESACNVGDLGWIPGLARSPEKEMATHSSILAWKIPWMEEPGGLQSMGLQRVGHDWATSLPPLTFAHIILTKVSWLMFNSWQRKKFRNSRFRIKWRILERFLFNLVFPLIV